MSRTIPHPLSVHKKPLFQSVISAHFIVLETLLAGESTKYCQAQMAKGNMNK